jgi:hypothetical protein
MGLGNGVSRRSFLFFAFASYGLAFIEWALTPGVINLWMPFWMHNIPESAWWLTMLVLTAAWLSVAILAAIRFGWAALLLWLPIYWGLRLPVLVVMISVSCSVYHDCL